MGSTDKKIILDVLSLAIVYGLPEILRIVQAFSKDEITLEDVKQLGSRMKSTDELRNTPVGGYVEEGTKAVDPAD